MEELDVVVIGAGPAGENVAGRCADGGLRVAIVEAELVGGECSYWGCIPSKVLIRPGDVLAAAAHTPGAREATTGKVDVAATLARRDEMVSNWDDHGQLPWLEEKHVELVRGRGRLTGLRRVEVEAADGTSRVLEPTTAVVLATGTRAAMPPIPGLADAQPWDNRDVTGLQRLPARIVVLGGGAIGAEMAQALRRLGATEVTVVEGFERLLGREEPAAGERVRQAFEAEGITVITGAKVTEVRRPEAGGEVTVVLDDGGTVAGDELLVAVGRRPATGDVGLDTVGLEPGAPVAVDDQLRATGVAGDWLYAVGDCNGRSLLTHMGKYQARIAADVILGKDVADRADASAVTRVTFTDPQVAAAGLTEAQARELGIEVRVVSYDLAHVAGTSVRGQHLEGTAVLVIDEARRVIVGATFVGPDVQELVHAAAIAIVAEVPLATLWHAVPVFPTVSEVWLRLLEEYGL
jgi:pyruvate/2-oxoglutarate dehydrogenase complex dihydrolipoamide dehydrogenase (E3) component